jgi:hypothetical protein
MGSSASTLNGFDVVVNSVKKATVTILTTPDVELQYQKVTNKYGTYSYLLVMPKEPVDIVFNIKNHTTVKVDFDIFVNNVTQGTWQIGANESGKITRPTKEDRAFTSVALNSDVATDANVDKKDTNNGAIKFVFKFEKPSLLEGMKMKGSQTEYLSDRNCNEMSYKKSSSSFNLFKGAESASKSHKSKSTVTQYNAGTLVYGDATGTSYGRATKLWNTEAPVELLVRLVTSDKLKAKKKYTAIIESKQVMYPMPSS